MVYRGIDVAYVQGVVDWDKVKPQIDFAIIRAGYGQGNIDAQARRNLSECNRLGIPCGVFWFSYALDEDMVVQEALDVLDFVKDYCLDLPIFYDFEYDSRDFAQGCGVNLDGATISRFNDIFCQTIRDGGYYPAIYTNSDYINNLLDMSIIGKYDLWYAHYGVPALDHDCRIWQYTDALELDGIDAKVDGDYMYDDYPSIIRQAGLNNLTPTPAPIEPAPIFNNTPSAWASEAVQKAIAKGLTGDADGNLHLQDCPTVEHILVILSKIGVL